MPNYVQLDDNNIVTGVTKAAGTIDAAHMIEIAEYDTTLLGKKYENNVFVDGPVVVLPSIITKIALLNRMTDAEFIAIINAAKTDAEVELWKTRFDNATSIDLTSTTDRVVAGFPMLVTKCLLTQERSVDILTTEVQSAERP
jgi:hypothetical protein